MGNVIAVGLIWAVLIAGLMVFLSLPDYFTQMQNNMIVGFILLVGIVTTAMIMKKG